VRNITVTVPDEIYRDARVRAAERGSSVSALVGDFLRSLSDDASKFARLEAQQHAVQQRIERFSAGDRLIRETVHERALR
jgi:plasmid stability protein